MEFKKEYQYVIGQEIIATSLLKFLLPLIFSHKKGISCSTIYSFSCQ